MKKLVSLAVFSMVFAVLTGAVYSAEVQQPQEKPKEKVVTPREFISQEQPEVVQQLLGGVLGATPMDSKSFYSGKTPGVYDYLLRKLDAWVINESGELEDGALFILFEVACGKDKNGYIIPWECDGKQIAVRFERQKVSWFQSAEAKKLFEMILAQMATK